MLFCIGCVLAVVGLLFAFGDKLLKRLRYDRACERLHKICEELMRH